MGVTLEQAKDFLLRYFGDDVTDVEAAGAGAWSTCFGFKHHQQNLVIRFGKYMDDFQTDQRVYRFNTPDLPIPKVLDIGEALNGYYAISTRIYGEPLEHLSSTDWKATVPSLVATLEAIRLADTSYSTGFGGWDSEGNGLRKSWAGHLLAVNEDLPYRRTYGWQEKLKTSPEDYEVFEWGYGLLEQVAHVSAPRNLVHCDLMNRNVFVKDKKISGVFDWGCALHGDHLYDLAWFEFWAPWHPELDIEYLRNALEQRWLETDYLPKDSDSRLLACHLHIGLDHLAYNAHLGDWSALTATAQRMKTLVKKYT